MKRYWLISQYLFKKLLYSVKSHYPNVSKAYTHQYPSVQLSHKLNNWDYGINFSSEILIGGVVVVVALINLFIFNPFSSEYTHADSSLASALLNNHPNMNAQLANRQNMISTKVVSEGIFAQASADEGQVLGETTEVAFSEESQIDDTGITKSNPDSVQGLLNNQVTIYEADTFDTVYTVAEKFKLHPDTIKYSNDLPNYALKKGWKLVIPKEDGVVIQIANPNLTLTDVADAYQADIKKIVSYNMLEDEEDMVDVGGYLVIPGGKPKPAAAPTPAPSQTAVAKATKKPAVPQLKTISGNHKFAPGYCTDYVARKVPGIKWGGNANRWIANSKAYGATVDRNPVAGAILVTSENARYGHVAYIESVNGDQVTISEWNYAGLYKKTVRTLDIDDKRIKGVIHP